MALGLEDLSTWWVPRPPLQQSEHETQLKNNIFCLRAEKDNSVWVWEKWYEESWRYIRSRFQVETWNMASNSKHARASCLPWLQLPSSMKTSQLGGWLLLWNDVKRMQLPHSSSKNIANLCAVCRCVHREVPIPIASSVAPVVGYPGSEEYCKKQYQAAQVCPLALPISIESIIPGIPHIAPFFR